MHTRMHSKTRSLHQKHFKLIEKKKTFENAIVTIVLGILIFRLPAFTVWTVKYRQDGIRKYAHQLIMMRKVHWKTAHNASECQWKHFIGFWEDNLSNNSVDADYSCYVRVYVVFILISHSQFSQNLSLYP